MSRRRPAACRSLPAPRHRTPSTVRDSCLQKSTSTPTPHAFNCTRQLPAEVYQHPDTARRQLYETAACRSLPAPRHRTPSTVRDSCLQKSTSTPTTHAVNCTRQLPAEVYQHPDTARRQLYETAACRSLPAPRHRTPSTVRDSCLQKSTSTSTPHAVNCTRQLPAEVYQHLDTARRQLYETAACRSLPAPRHRKPSTVRDSCLQKSTSSPTPHAVNCTRQLPAEVYQRSDTASRQLYETAACRSLPAPRHRMPSTVRDSCLQKSTSAQTPPAVNCTRQLPAEVYQRSDTACRQLYETAACRNLPAVRHRTPSTVRDRLADLE